jgi:dTDP-4-dehydrorhamnose 3,5-epimerase
MIFTATALPGAFVIEPERREDHRGFFSRVSCQREFEEHGLSSRVVQVNVGFTLQQGGLRGMHFQLPPKQEVKLVRCTMGALYDVVVDLRPDSPTYRRWIGVELTAQSRRMLYVPAGCAHGYQTLTDNTEMYYQTSEDFTLELARGVRYDDPAFGIVWPLPVTSISDADRSWPDFGTGPVPDAGAATRRQPA